MQQVWPTPQAAAPGTQVAGGVHLQFVLPAGHGCAVLVASAQVLVTSQQAWFAEHCAPVAAHASGEMQLPVMAVSQVRPVQQTSPLPTHAWPSAEHVYGCWQVPARHCSPVAALQQSAVAAQAWPLAAQVVPLVPQVPLVAPLAMLHWSPLQQSAPIVQLRPEVWHGVRQTPRSHVPEQQSPFETQAVPFVVHEGEQIPFASQVAPAQQGRPPPVHVPPSGVQLGFGRTSAHT